ncbi:MAG: hypothetical protein ACTSWQ_03465, partial [Candidatus Thorarchaeota archaeon]
MSKEESYAEIVVLIEPEDLPEEKISQYSVSQVAGKLRKVLEQSDEKKNALAQKGLQFNGRSLLIGPPGTDFESFVHHIAREH